ncbi:MAG: histone deacetylase [Verrucomicrobiota bacterium]
MSLPFQIVYAEGYDLHLGDHVFPSVKFRLIRERLLADGFADTADFVEPQPATMEDVLRVHTREWATALRHGTLTYQQIQRLEIPYSSRMVDAFFLATGGTILAAHNALRDRVGVNLSGGFHHAYPDHGEGFCALHDVAIAIRALQADGSIRRAMVVDVDVHHGNGTAAIFSHDESVLTLSIHELDNYPFHKPFSDIDIPLARGTGDAEYLRILERALTPALTQFRPDLVMYIAGSDPYREDKLGGLALSIEGLAARDKLVFGVARAQGIPIAMTLAGGYALLLQDTITIHANTVKAAL